MKKTKRINFWLGDKDLALIDRKAKADGVCRSEFIRKLIRETEIIPVPDVDYSKYVDEFRRLGNDLNNIVIRYNVTGNLDSALIESVWKKIIKTAETLKQELIEKTTDLEVRHCGKKE